MSEEQLKRIQEEITAKQLNADNQKMDSYQQDVVMQNQDQSLAETQLDPSKDLINFYYQLNGYILKPDPDTQELVWKKEENNDLSFLSQEGINYCFWMVQGYLTKNTLLSNYDEKTINNKMEDIATTIADALFMKYDTYFKYPTLEECKVEIKRRIQNKIDIRKFACELSGVESNEEEIRNGVIKEMEGRILHELETIKSQKMKDKLKMYESLHRIIQDTIHSAYQRAWKGQERQTLRQHISISENKGGGWFPQGNNNVNEVSPLSFLNKRR